MNPPCVNCIVLPMCKAKFKKDDALLTIVHLSFNCILLSRYIYQKSSIDIMDHINRDKKRIKVINYFNGIAYHESSL